MHPPPSGGPTDALPRVASLTTLGLLLAAGGFAVSSWTLEGLSWPTRLVALVALAGVAWGVRALALADLGALPFTGLLVALVVLPRLAWVFALPTLPVYDYARYQAAARALLHGAVNGCPIQDFGIVVWHGALGALFGGGLLAGKSANVLLAAVTAMLLLALGRRLLGEAAGRAAALLFALWPADIAFRGVLATEFVFVVAWLAGCLVLLHAAGRRETRVLEFAGAGALLGLAASFRPIGLLLLAVSLAWVAVRARAEPRRRVVALSLALVGGFALVVALQLAIGKALGFDTRASSLGLNILTGTDATTQGQYGDEAGAEFARWVAEGGHGHALAAAVREGWRRISSRPAAFLALAVAKYGGMWGDDGYGVYWASERVGEGLAGDWVLAHRTALFAASQFYYLGLLAAGAFGCWTVIRRRRLGDLALLVMAVPAFALVHVVLEVQTRYHYPAAHVVVLLGAAGLVSGGLAGPGRRLLRPWLRRPWRARART